MNKMENLKNHLKGHSSNTKLTSGFEDLDKIIHSFAKSNLYILAGRPGMGKTTFALNVINNLALNQKANVFVISYEMTGHQILCRLLAINSGLANNKILNNEIKGWEIDLLNRIETKLENATIFVDCPASLNFKGIKEKVKDLKEKNGIDFLFIDDIQRITISDEDRKYAVNREQEVSKNVRDLKSLAKEMEIPILAISQLNRDNKERYNRKPILTDIIDSGAIENDSDVVIFLYRPEYYGITEDEEGDSLIGIAEFEIAKNRHGSIGELTLQFKKEIPSFCNHESFPNKSSFDEDPFSKYDSKNGKSDFYFL